MNFIALRKLKSDPRIRPTPRPARKYPRILSADRNLFAGCRPLYLDIETFRAAIAGVRYAEFDMPNLRRRDRVKYRVGRGQGIGVKTGGYGGHSSFRLRLIRLGTGR